MRATVLVATGLAVAAALVPVGVATATTPPVLTVQADQRLATVGHESIGVNTAVWNGHLVDPGVAGQVRRAGFGELEFNGGGVMDLYHWRDGSLSPDPEAALHKAEDLDYAAIPPRFSFDEFERAAHQVGAGTLVHVNYGTGSP
jgi:alpha-N-arabinofuranosidase